MVTSFMIALSLQLKKYYHNGCAELEPPGGAVRVDQDVRQGQTKIHLGQCDHNCQERTGRPGRYPGGKACIQFLPQK